MRPGRDGAVVRRPRTSWAAWLLAGCLGAAALTGCTESGATIGRTGSPARDTLPAGPSLTWSPANLPAGTEPITVAPLGDQLLVGALGAGTMPSPRLLTLTVNGVATSVPLAPHSYYAALARWKSVDTDGTRILAIGGAAGGAHGNTRWTVWSGTTREVVEQPQGFELFGGPRAGGLLGAVVMPGGEALVGSWQGVEAGLDAVVYLAPAGTWTRTDPAGTAIQSTRSRLVSPRSAVRSGPGLVLAGSVLRLGGGAVTQQASVWRSTGPNAGWHLIGLPDAGPSSEAISARCDGLRCLIAGRSDGSLAWWHVDGDTATRVAGLPPVGIGETDPVCAPQVIKGREVQLTAQSGHVVALTRTSSGWTRSAGPAGVPIVATLVGERLYVIVSPGREAPSSSGVASAPAVLWQTDTRVWH